MRRTLWLAVISWLWIAGDCCFNTNPRIPARWSLPHPAPLRLVIEVPTLRERTTLLTFRLPNFRAAKVQHERGPLLPARLAAVTKHLGDIRNSRG